MDEADDAGIEIDPGHHDNDARARSPRLGPTVRVVLTAVLVVLLALSVTFAVVMVRQHNQDQAAITDRNDAVDVAQQFTLRLDAIDYKNLDQYSKQVSALLTDKMKADFAKNFTGFQQAFKQIQFTSKGTVLAAGIQDIDADSGTVLVIHDVAVKSKGCVQPPYKRMSVDLRKIKGTWLVDNFKEDVPGCQG